VISFPVVNGECAVCTGVLTFTRKMSDVRCPPKWWTVVKAPAGPAGVMGSLLGDWIVGCTVETGQGTCRPYLIGVILQHESPDEEHIKLAVANIINKTTFPILVPLIYLDVWHWRRGDYQYPDSITFRFCLFHGWMVANVGGHFN
jgi:hypothetical protein